MKSFVLIASICIAAGATMTACDKTSPKPPTPSSISATDLRLAS